MIVRFVLWSITSQNIITPVFSFMYRATANRIVDWWLRSLTIQIKLTIEKLLRSMHLHEPSLEQCLIWSEYLLIISLFWLYTYPILSILNPGQIEHCIPFSPVVKCSPLGRGSPNPRLEGWPSGRRRRSWKPVWSNPSWVRIPLPPLASLWTDHIHSQWTIKKAR